MLEILEFNRNKSVGSCQMMFVDRSVRIDRSTVRIDRSMLDIIKFNPIENVDRSMEHFIDRSALIDRSIKQA